MSSIDFVIASRSSGASRKRYIEAVEQLRHERKDLAVRQIAAWAHVGAAAPGCRLVLHVGASLRSRQCAAKHAVLLLKTVPSTCSWEKCRISLAPGCSVQ